MTALRALAFNGAFYGVTAVLAVALLPLALGPPAWTWAVARLWAWVARMLLKAVVGLRIEVRGAVPTGPVIVAAKHQSAIDTLILFLLLRNPSFVMKRELTWIPVLGLWFIRGRQIALDRSAGASALRRLMRAGERTVAEGRAVVIFPEGTRVPPGERRPYHPGVAALYDRLKVPVVPVALNSGLFWGRRAWKKRAGCFTVEFLEPMPPGLPKRAFLAELETRIETAAVRLVEEVAAEDRSGPSAAGAALP